MTKAAPRDPDKEERIFSAAMHIFASRGYQNAKTDDIVTQAGVSKGLLFHYFGSKANLYVETVKRAYRVIEDAADYSVWQDAPDLTTMITSALKYKIQLQMQYPDEFAMAIAAYTNNATLPQKMQDELGSIWSSQLTTSVPMLTKPVIERMHLRDDVEPETVMELMSAISLIIGEKAKARLQANPHLPISELEDFVDETKKYMDVLIHGFQKQ